MVPPVAPSATGTCGNGSDWRWPPDALVSGGGGGGGGTGGGTPHGGTGGGGGGGAMDSEADATVIVPAITFGGGTFELKL